MSPYRAPGEVQLEAVDPDATHGRIMPWRGAFEKCCVCGALPSPKGSHSYTASGGTVDGLPCRFVVVTSYEGRWYTAWFPGKVETLCGDPRPHFHAKCRVCAVRFKMAPAPM